MTQSEKETEALDKAKVSQIRKEYPWIDSYVDPYHLLGAKISRITQELLDGRIKWQHDSTGCISSSACMYFVGEDGGKLLKVGYIDPVPDPEFRRWKFWKWMSRLPQPIDERPSEALIRMEEESGKVCFILQLVPEENNNFFRIVIYKSPKGFTLRDWASQVEKRALNALQQQKKSIEEKARELLLAEEADAGKID